MGNRTSLHVASSLLILVLLLADIPSAHADAKQPPTTMAQGAAAAAVPATLTIVVRVTNQTPSAPPHGKNVPLRLYSSDGKTFTLLEKGITDANGTLLLKKIPNIIGRTYGVVAISGQTEYPSQMIAPRPGQETLVIPVGIFDTTTDTRYLRIEELDVVGRFVGPGTLQVTNDYLLSNGGNRTIVGGGRTSDGPAAPLHFELPEGATRLEFVSGDDQSFRRTTSGFDYMRGVPPGAQTTEIKVQYTLAYTGQLQLKVRVPYPTMALNLLVADQGVAVSSGTVRDVGRRQAPGGEWYRGLSFSTLGAGASAAIQLSGDVELLASTPTQKPVPSKAH